MSCPNCRNELPFNEWKRQINHDENRTKDAAMLDQLTKSFNPDEFTKKSFNLFQIILNKFNGIHSIFKFKKNDKLNFLIEEFNYSLVNPSIEEIS